MNEQKQNMIARIYAIIKKRDIMRQQFLDDRDNFNAATLAWIPEFSRFCCFTKPTVKVSKITGAVDPIAMAVATGRREAFEWILQRLNFSDDNALKMIEQLNQQED